MRQVQSLIVEGRDAYSLSAICEKAGLGLPKGYDERNYGEFVIAAGGIDRAKLAFKEQLNSPEVSNIDIVMDANSEGFEPRLNSVVSMIKAKFPDFYENKNLSSDKRGWTWQVHESLKIGLWVMPDNSSTGYLESFLVRLVPESNDMWTLSEAFVLEAQKVSGPRSGLSGRIKDKALLAAFLSVQVEPGMSPTTAIKKGILDVSQPEAQKFLNWFSITFELEK